MVMHRREDVATALSFHVCYVISVAVSQIGHVRSLECYRGTRDTIPKLIVVSKPTPHASRFPWKIHIGCLRCVDVKTMTNPAAPSCSQLQQALSTSYRTPRAIRQGRWHHASQHRGTQIDGRQHQTSNVVLALPILYRQLGRPVAVARESCAGHP